MAEEQTIKSMEQFLQGLGIGELDSQGHFSLNAGKAHQKLQTHSLADPGLFVVELLAFAVASGATKFEISSNSEGLTASFDGEPPIAEDFLDPPATLLNRSTDSRALHLSLALLGAQELADGSGLELRSSCGKTLLWDDGSWKVEEAEGGAGTEVSVFRLRRPYRFLSEKLRKKPSLEDVLAVGYLAPLNQKINDRWVYKLFHPVATSEQLAGRLLVSGRFPFKKYLDQNTGLHREVKTDSNFTAVLLFGALEASRKQGLAFLRNGIQYRVESEDLGPCVSGIVASPEIKRDLSGAGIVKDSAYRSIIAELREHITNFLQELVTSELRARSATLELKPLVEQQPASNELAEWLSWVEERSSSELKKQSTEELYASLRDCDDEEAESTALLHMEQFLKGSNGYTYDYRKVVGQTSAQQWVFDPRLNHPRLKSFGGLVAACSYLSGKGWPEYEREQEPLALLELRLQNKLEEALERLQTQEELGPVELRSLLEIWLNQGHLERVVQRCCQELDLPSTEALAGFSFYSKSAFVAEHLAFALQLQSRTREAAQAYQTLLDHSYSDYTNYLRSEVWCSLNRGQIPRAQWLKNRVQTSGRGAWLFLTSDTQMPPRSLSRALSGRFDKDLEDDLSQYFYSTGKIYRDTFDFYVTNIAQKLRLAGHTERANTFAARGELHMESHRRREALLKPNANNWY